ncbi:hypothetical protein KVR01_000028 [Diaporthe batatas]|uniref:uncharacterized protein n=1 Tax=Diaporthe batatas TaxID=748121 RepID=UPI001D05AAAD|nr:uncharacterized protein KVR01_000028 [Diaporthe batatas]KAG8169283.1 hypothetical protein KVR01_000028 [Diaporthe batatas]
MTRIISSAMRPLRLNASRRLRLAVTAAAPTQTTLPFEARRAATTTTTTARPNTPAKPAPAQTTPYKRSATTNTNTTNTANAAASNSRPSPAANTPFAESQINPVPSAPYARPQGMGAIPEAPPAPAPGGHGDPAFGGNGIDWSSSFHGLSTVPFSPEVAAVLMRPIPFEDVEIKPDGIIYLPEIKYRRILNQAFGPGGWGMAPRGELMVGDKVVTREYALLVHGRFIAQARGECQFFADDGIATAGEGCKSNALMRCCKDLGIASELWDPRYIRDFKKKWAQEIWVEHVVTKKKRQTWVRKGDDPAYPFKRS